MAATFKCLWNGPNPVLSSEDRWGKYVIVALPLGQKHQTLQFIAKLLWVSDLKVVQMETISFPRLEHGVLWNLWPFRDKKQRSDWRINRRVKCPLMQNLEKLKQCLEVVKNVTNAPCHDHLCCFERWRPCTMFHTELLNWNHPVCAVTSRNEWPCLYPLRCEIAAVFGWFVLHNVLSEVPLAVPRPTPASMHVLCDGVKTYWLPLFENNREPGQHKEHVQKH